MWGLPQDAGELGAGAHAEGAQYCWAWRPWTKLEPSAWLPAKQRMLEAGLVGEAVVGVGVPVTQPHELQAELGED